ncbi:hypothetical protein MOF37_22085, partial [Bacillus spizizenii]|nr:hypothetical protein [Bacillus spizizenii]
TTQSLIKCMEKINIRKERLSLIEYLNVLVKIQALYDVISDAAFERFKVRRQQTAKIGQNG